MSTIAPPSIDISFRVTVSLRYLGATGDDVDTVILAARSAVAELANASTSALTIAAITAAVEAVPGVALCDRVLLNGVAADVDAASFLTATQYVRADVVIEPQ